MNPIFLARWLGLVLMAFPISGAIADDVLFSVTPAIGVDAGGTLLTITGPGAETLTSVQVGTAPCAELTVETGQATCKTPAGTAGAPVDVVGLADALPLFTLSARFTYFAPLTIQTSTQVISAEPSSQNTVQFKAVGGIAPYTYSLSGEGGSLYPPSQWSDMGSVQGSKPGALVLEAADSAGNRATTLIEVRASLTVSGAESPVYYKDALTVTIAGGVSPFRFEVPEGMSLVQAPDSATVRLGDFKFTGTRFLRVLDSLGNYREVPIQVYAVGTLDETFGEHWSHAYSLSAETEPVMISQLKNRGTSSGGLILYSAAFPDHFDGNSTYYKTAYVKLVKVELGDSRPEIRYGTYLPLTLGQKTDKLNVVDMVEARSGIFVYGSLGARSYLAKVSHSGGVDISFGKSGLVLGQEFPGRTQEILSVLQREDDSRILVAVRTCMITCSVSVSALSAETGKQDSAFGHLGIPMVMGRYSRASLVSSGGNGFQILADNGRSNYARRKIKSFQFWLNDHGHFEKPAIFSLPNQSPGLDECELDDAISAEGAGPYVFLHCYKAPIQPGVAMSPVERVLRLDSVGQLLPEFGVNGVLDLEADSVNDVFGGGHRALVLGNRLWMTGIKVGTEWGSAFFKFDGSRDTAYGVDGFGAFISSPSLIGGVPYSISMSYDNKIVVARYHGPVQNE